MSLRYPKVISPAHLDSNSTALVKPGTNILVTQSASGDYTVAATGSSRTFTALTTTTNGSAVATVNLSSYAFSTVPVVSLTPVNTSTTQATIAVITAISTTSLSIRTFITQNTTVSILGAVVSPVTSAPNIAVHIILCSPVS